MELTRKIDPVLINTAIKEGFDACEAINGWFLAEDNILSLKRGETIFLNANISIAHIEKIDVMDVFDSDEEAARDAERRCKIAIIRDIPELLPIYVDNYKNRRVIEKEIKKYRKEHGIK